MSSIAIRVDELSKEYHIGAAEQSFDRIGDQMLHMVSAPFRRAGRLLRGKASSAAELDETIWALRDITFDVDHGEVVGIIGRNGAGKSTLLKILSRITDPTEGEATIYGRVGSLLEVGTGFHPELTGRENVFLNGAILGMKKDQIQRRFDEIVAFAELDKFIDTPVKHYSSGMYVRLAFSVAAHLEPEILLVDEVLAVGDVAFQRKCLGKMGTVAEQGRTVLFVSHNMSLMQMLCERGIFLKDGRIDTEGTIVDAVDAYLKSLEEVHSEDLKLRTDRKGLGKTRLTQVDVVSHNGSRSMLQTGRPAHFIFNVSNSVPDMHCSFFIYDQMGQPVASFKSKAQAPVDKESAAERPQFICDIDELLILPGRYRIDASIIGDNRLQDHLEAVAVFDVAEGDVHGRVARKEKRFRVTIPHRWQVP